MHRTRIEASYEQVQWTPLGFRRVSNEPKTILRNAIKTRLKGRNKKETRSSVLRRISYFGGCFWLEKVGHRGASVFEVPSLLPVT